jgi:hypothetical protein
MTLVIKSSLATVLFATVLLGGIFAFGSLGPCGPGNWISGAFFIALTPAGMLNRALGL